MSEQTPKMTSNRPYLLRALYEWISDNQMTPYLLADATQEGVQVPSSAVKDGRIVLNIAMRAVANLDLNNHDLRFAARFGGVSQSVIVPIRAVLAIYAQETGQGMMLPDDGIRMHEEQAEDMPEPPENNDPPPAPKNTSHLRVVK
jgi:stringent starvation protein B